MRFKLTIPKEQKHTEPVNCVGWTTSDEFYSIGDDHMINKSNLINAEVQRVAELSNDFYPTDMHWFPKSNAAGKKIGAPDLFALAASDGRFFIMSKKCVDIPPEAEYQDNLDLVMVVNIHKYCKVRVRKCSAIHWENVGSSSRNDSQ